MRREIERLVSIRTNSGKPVTALFVVESARDFVAYPKLNEHLWQVPEADLAAEARLQRAHRLLITMTITVADTGDTTRMLVHTPGSHGYQPIDVISRVPDVAVLKMRRLIEDIARARARLRAFRAAIPGDVADEIEALLREAEHKTSAMVDAEEMPAS